MLQIELPSLRNKQSVRPTFQLPKKVDSAQNIFSSSMTSNVQIMVVMPPRRLAHQVIKPLMYNFNNNFMNTLDRLYHSNNPTNLTNLNSSLASAIQPSGNGGIHLKTDLFSEMWSFLLLINVSNNGDLHSQRTLMAGYFTDEPINPITGRENPYAKMFFTSSSILTGSKTPNIFGSKLQLRADSITVDNSVTTRMSTDEKDVYFNLPGDLVEFDSSFRHQSSSIDLSPFAMSNMIGRTNLPKSSVIPTTVVNEIGQLIVNGINEADISSYGIENTTPHSIGDDGMNHPFGVNNIDYMVTYKLMNDLPSIGRRHDRFNVTNGIDPTNSFITLGSLNQQLPNLQILNIKAKGGSMFDVQADGRDQEEDSRQNTLSYLLSYAIEPVAIDAGIGSIAFEYHSHVSKDTLYTGRNPEWFISRAMPITDVDATTLNGFIEKFKRRMEESVFITVSSMLGDGFGTGDFVCWVDYSHGTDCKVQIKLLDYQSSHKPGFYKSYGFLSSIVAPTVGNTNVIGNNINQINKLKTVGELFTR